MSERSTLLGIYLNDHLAGATGGLALFRRATSSAQGASKAELAELTQQVTQDRQSLLTLMHRLGVPVRHYKVATGWALEKAGRLKTNGHLLHRSPLSDLVELEALVLGVQGKAAGFRALRSIAQHDPRFDVTDLDRLIDRAERRPEAGGTAPARRSPRPDRPRPRTDRQPHHYRQSPPRISESILELRMLSEMRLVTDPAGGVQPLNSPKAGS